MYEALIENNLTVHREVSRGSKRYYKVNCPMCSSRGGSEDTGGHMHIFLDTWFGHCFRCGFHGHVTKILMEVGVSDLPQQSLTDYLKDRLTDKLSEAQEELQCTEPSEDFLPEGTVRNWLDRPSSLAYAAALNQLRKWGVSVQTAKEMKWYWNIRERMFVFPFFYNGKLVYYSKRGIDSNRLRLASEKGDFSTTGVMYNWDDPLKHDVQEVFIVEGQKDAAILHQQGLWAVALSGHTISPYQELRLKSLPHQKVLMLDADVTLSSDKYEKMGWRVVYLPYDDPAEYRDNIKEAIQNSEGLSSKILQLFNNRQVS